MYDDEGFKIKINNPYEIKKLEPISKVINKINDKYKKSKRNFLYKNINQEAKSIYKRTANIHKEEQIFHAYEIMSPDIIMITSDKIIHECWLLMEQNDLKQLAVVDLYGKIQGVVSMKNIAKAIIDNIQNPDYMKKIAVKEIVTYNIITAEPISDIRRIAKVMIKYHLNSIPIVDAKSDKIVGVVSRADILKAISTVPHFQYWA
jgi:CBS domain-containing protein